VGSGLRFCGAEAATVSALKTFTFGNVFGGFTPLKWVSSNKYKCDDSLKTFLFTLKTHTTSRRRSSH
jgi:hypothetical protein